MVQECRINPRHSESGCVAVTIISALHDPDLEGKIFFCLAGDISVDGLSFKVHRPIQEGAALEISVHLVDPVEVFIHRARIVRCAKDAQDVVIAYRVGVHLIHGSCSGEAAWKEAVESRGKRPDSTARALRNSPKSGDD